MKISVDTHELARTSADWIAIPLTQNERSAPRLPARIAQLDENLGGCIRASLERNGFEGRRNEKLAIFPPTARTRRAPGRCILLVGLGKTAKLDSETLRQAAGTAVRHTTSKKARTLAIAVPSLGRIKPAPAAQALAEGAILGNYRFDRYRSSKSPANARLRQVSLFFEAGAGLKDIREAASRGAILAESQNLARDLSNEPPNSQPPAALARAAQVASRKVGNRCQVFGVPQLERMKMGGILAVGGGSVRPPRLVVMQHNPPGTGKGRKSRRPTICVVGKGITFDSGGISIKPAAAMDEMKHDMSGAATVVGVMSAAARLRLPIHLVGIIAAAENLPSGTAYRPGDVISTHSGKTVEILNTDAEGRIVLADALHYGHTRFEPEAMVDLATLTGACQVALGPWATGMFGTDDSLIQAIRRAGDRTGERAWPMPLLDEHREAVRSQIGDLKNTGGRHAGASTAAGFLAAFVGKTPWVHLDIAGTGWTTTVGPTQPRGATGVGVRLLVEWLRNLK